MNSMGWLFNLLVSLLVALLVNGSAVTRDQGGKVVLCYFEGDAAVRPQEEVRFTPEDVDVTICTHLVYRRALINRDLEVVSDDWAVDLWEDGGSAGIFNRTLKLKELRPGLKILIEVLDTEEGIYWNQTSIDRFTQNAADFVQNIGFDGMVFRPMNYSERFDGVAEALHEEFSRRGLKLMTVLLPTGYHYGDTFVMTEPLSRYFDLILLASYLNMPAAHLEIFSPLPKLARTVEGYTALGIPPEKLVVIIPTFSASMKLCHRADCRVGSQFCGSGDEGSYESLKMILHSSELMRKMANTSEDWIIERDEEAKVPYGHSKSLEWTSFEDTASVQAKAEFILESNLAGAAMMSINLEDFKGSSTENGKTFPLTRAVYEALNQAPYTVVILSTM